MCVIVCDVVVCDVVVVCVCVCGGWGQTAVIHTSGSCVMRIEVKGAANDGGCPHR